MRPSALNYIAYTLTLLLISACESNVSEVDALVGEAHSNESLYINPQNYNHGEAKISNASLSKPIQLSNQGDTPLIINKITFSDAQIGLGESSACRENILLNKGASCDLVLEINPKNSDAQSHNIAIDFYNEDKSERWSNTFEVSWLGVVEGESQEEILEEPYTVLGFIAEFNIKRDGLVSWSKSGGDIKEYRIAFKEGSEPPENCNSGISVPKNSSDEYSEVITGFEKFDVEYTIQLCVITKSDAEILLQSATLTRDTPKYIADFHAQFLDSSNAKLTWLATADSNVSKYKISYNQGSTPPENCSGSSNVKDASGTTATISGLSDTLYTFRLCPVLSDGSLGLGETIRAEGGSPKVTLKSRSGSYSVSGVFTIDVSFNQPVSELKQSDISVSGGSVQSLVKNGSNFILKAVATASSAKVTIKKGAVKNNSGLPNDAVEISLYYDTTAPTATISGLSTSSTSLSTTEVTITFSEKVQNVSSAISLTGASLTSLTESDKIYRLLLANTTEGTISVSVDNTKITDLSGNNLASSVSYSYSYDKTGPTASSVSIASGASYTSSQRISIALLATGSPSQMVINESSDCSGSADWVDYSTLNIKSLSASSGTATVSAKFRDVAGNESSCISDSIGVDTANPSAVTGMSITLSSTSITYSFTASTDSDSGIADYQIAVGSSLSSLTDMVDFSSLGSTSASGTYSTSLSLSAGQTYYISIRATDNAGNIGSSAYTGVYYGWQNQAYLKAPNTEADDHFGAITAISGDTVVVGAPYEDSNQATITNGSTASSDNTWSSTGAAYVFTRSASTWSQEAYLKPSNMGYADYFGEYLSISGNTVVVGSYREDSNQSTITSGSAISDNNSSTNSGSVYVFVRSGTTWSQEAYLKASNSHTKDEFGSSVDIDGNTIIVGAEDENSAQITITNGAGASTTKYTSREGMGAVYVFSRTGTTWSQEAYIKAANGHGYDYFGDQVAISGETIIVGATGEDSNQSTITNGTTASSNNSNNYAGAAYIYSRSASSWSQQAYLKPPVIGNYDYFGRSVDIDGNTVIVGVSGDDSGQTTITNGSTAPSDNDAGGSGAVYVYTRSGSTWSQEAYLKSSNLEADAFGYSVAISGNTVVVGSYNEDSNQSTITNGATASSDNSTENAGAAYVFSRSATSWSQEGYLKAPNPGTTYSSASYYGDSFGRHVSISASTIAVGARYEDSNQSTITNGSTASSDNSSSNSGAVYIFKK